MEGVKLFFGFACRLAFFIQYRYVNIGGKNFYIEGHKGIQLLSNEEITFKLKKKIISIKGHDLFVKYIDNSTAVIFGTIVQVNVLWNQKWLYK